MKKRFPVSIIIDLYNNGKNVKSISEIYNCHSCTIQRLLKRNGVLKSVKFNNRKYTINESYFDNIDTQEKAYWLGVMVTDGCVDNNFAVRLNLNSNDEYHIKKFQEAIGSNHMLFHANEGTAGTSCLCIKNKHMALALREKGIIAHKKKVYKVHQELEIDYWRGVVDGDGFISCNAHCSIGICGTKEICFCFKRFCKKYIKTKAKVVKQKNNDIWTFVLHGNIAITICKLLYDNAVVFLKRKKEKYLNSLKLLSSRKYGFNEFNDNKHKIWKKIKVVLKDTNVFHDR